MTAGPAGSPSQGIFARMAERLRAVFAVKPADDDDDWGDDAGLATASPEPSAPAPAAKPVGKSKPSRGGMGADASGASSAPSLHPAIEEDMTVKPAWQERLRRSRTAERLP